MADISVLFIFDRIYEDTMFSFLWMVHNKTTFTRMTRYRVRRRERSAPRGIILGWLWAAAGCLSALGLYTHTDFADAQQRVEAQQWVILQFQNVLIWCRCKWITFVDPHCHRFVRMSSKADRPTWKKIRNITTTHSKKVNSCLVY